VRLTVKVWLPDDDEGGDLLDGELEIEPSDQNEVALHARVNGDITHTIYCSAFEAGLIAASLAEAADGAAVA
jgi:hypothetical protein